MLFKSKFIEILDFFEMLVAKILTQSIFEVIEKRIVEKETYIGTSNHSYLASLNCGWFFSLLFFFSKCFQSF
jgi:hypothetical protein